MEVTINYNGQAVAVEVTLEVYEFLDRADHKTENLFQALLFFPAKMTGSYYPFLLAYFILTCGLSFLETSSNPYILSDVYKRQNDRSDFTG